MITEPELRAELRRRAETYEVPPPDLVSLRAVALRRRRDLRLRYGGTAAAGLLAVGLAWGQLGADQVLQPADQAAQPADQAAQPADRRSDVAISPSCFPPGQTPPVPDSPWAGANFVSDEPVTVSPTPPGDQSCTLVLRYAFHRFGAGAGFGPDEPGLSGMVFLYSDGRLIVDTATEEDWFVQWERRLTPAGVERLRTAVVDMLGETCSLPRCNPSPRSIGGIHYGDGNFAPKDPQALVRLLIDRSWLPDEDWVTESAAIYRAAWYLTCYNGPDVEVAVRALPSGARDVLESRAWTPLPPDPPRGVVESQCLVLSRADTRLLVEALGGDITVGTAIVTLGRSGGFSVHALMPDGTSGAHGD